MASIEDILMSLFQGAGVPAQEAADKVSQYAPLVAKAGKAALGPLGSLIGDTAQGAGEALNTVPAEAGPAALPGQIASLNLPPEVPTASAAPAPTPVPPANHPAEPPAPQVPETPPTMTSKAPGTPATAQTPPPMGSTPSGTSDEATRQAQLAAANKQAKMAAIPAAIAGIGGAIGNAASVFGARVPEGAETDILNRAQENLKTNKAAIEQNISNDPNSEASKSARQLVLQIAPQMANQPGFDQMTDQDLRNKLPLVDTMMKAKAAEDAKKMSLAQIQAMRDMNIGLREDQQQDKLEQNAKQMVSNLRGDKSLARAEEQRDAAIVAYNRINEIQKSGGNLNPVDYVDILGQIYKARTGAAPSEQVLRDIRQATAEGSLGKAYTFATGNQAPATSQAITNSLKNMAHSMGTQADQFHDNYMKAHLIKPTSLEESRWKPIVDTGRGISFAEATKQNAAPTSQSSSDPLGIR